MSSRKPTTPFIRIRGNHAKGKQIIATLKSLGGSNPTGYGGADATLFYYIDSDGKIATTNSKCDNFEFIEKNYREYTLPEPTRWAPARGETYYYVTMTINFSSPCVISRVNTGQLIDTMLNNAGNQFETYEQAMLGVRAIANAIKAESAKYME